MDMSIPSLIEDQQIPNDYVDKHFELCGMSHPHALEVN